MQAKFTIDNPNMLAEASAGDLFVPLGPDLVECVCTLRCIDGPAGVRADLPAAAHFNPDASLAIVVVGCRVGADEPEYYPAGYTTTLSGAAPIVFLQLDAPVQLRPRGKPIDQATLHAIQENIYPPGRDAAARPLYRDFAELQQHMVDITTRHASEALGAIKAALCTGDINQLPPQFDPGREELTSRL